MFLFPFRNVNVLSKQQHEETQHRWSRSDELNLSLLLPSDSAELLRGDIRASDKRLGWERREQSSPVTQAGVSLSPVGERFKGQGRLV